MTTPSIQTLRNQAELHHKHARNCKKAPDACQVCRTTIEWFREIPAPALSLVLEDRGKSVKQGSY